MAGTGRKVGDMITSMTGQASRSGRAAEAGWLWDLRSVNGKGLDLRLRLPEGLDAIETPLRTALAGRFQRGSISVTLRLTRDPAAAGARLNPAALAAVLDGLAAVGREAAARGLPLAAAGAAEVLAFRGVLEAALPDDIDDGPLRAAILADAAAAINDLAAARAAEGEALARVIAAQIDRVADLTGAAVAEAAASADDMAAALRRNLARILSETEAMDAARLAQELALLAVKADVTEETDRLAAHVEAARALLGAGGPVGRRLDFLTQEFHREANTLCSKAPSIALTRIGLDLKGVIDQMREQVQNVE
jgi:uncharacterized protein (TIGR00255 family)